MTMTGKLSIANWGLFIGATARGVFYKCLFPHLPPWIVVLLLVPRTTSGLLGQTGRGMQRSYKILASSLQYCEASLFTAEMWSAVFAGA
jgi:hypothetical protein